MGRKMKATKSGKYINPTDQARKEARKRELRKVWTLLVFVLVWFSIDLNFFHLTEQETTAYRADCRFEGKRSIPNNSRYGTAR